MSFPNYGSLRFFINTPSLEMHVHCSESQKLERQLHRNLARTRGFTRLTPNLEVQTAE